MDREGLSKIKRAELIARLELLERYIDDQEARVSRLHASGWDAKESEKRLELLRESHQLYRSALMHLLGEDFRESDDADPDADLEGDSGVDR